MEKTIRITTQKCSCGYILKKKQTIKKRLKHENFGFSLAHDPAHKVVDNISSAKSDVKSEVLIGDQDFIEISLICSVDTVHDTNKYHNFIVCPKCGTVLFSDIATTITEITE